MSKVVKHVKELSCYNNNVYELDGEFKGCTHVFEDCDETYGMSHIFFGIIKEGKFVKKLENFYIVFQDINDTETGKLRSFINGDISVEKILETNFSNHFYY